MLDSADDLEVLFGTSESCRDRRPLTTYLPQSPNGCILVTTRNKHLADKITGKRDNSIEVGPMAETEALELLTKKLGSLSDMDVGVTSYGCSTWFH